MGSFLFLKKNQTTPRPSEHPPVVGEKMSKRLGGFVLFYYYFFVRKYPSSCDCTEIRTHVPIDARRFRGYQLNHQGDRLSIVITFRGYINRVRLPILLVLS